MLVDVKGRRGNELGNGKAQKKGSRRDELPFGWSIADSNRLPQHCQCCALPDELIPRLMMLTVKRPYSVCGKGSVFFRFIQNISRF